MGLSHQCHSGAQPASTHRALESGLVDLQLAGCWMLGSRSGAGTRFSPAPRTRSFVRFVRSFRAFQLNEFRAPDSLTELAGWLAGADWGNATVARRPSPVVSCPCPAPNANANATCGIHPSALPRLVGSRWLRWLASRDALPLLRLTWHLAFGASSLTAAVLTARARVYVQDMDPIGFLLIPPASAHIWLVSRRMRPQTADECVCPEIDRSGSGPFDTRVPSPESRENVSAFAFVSPKQTEPGLPLAPLRRDLRRASSRVPCNSWPSPPDISGQGTNGPKCLRVLRSGESACGTIVRARYRTI